VACFGRALLFRRLSSRTPARPVGGSYEQAAKRFIGARMRPGAPWPWCRLAISADELWRSGWQIPWFSLGRLRKSRGVRVCQCTGCRHSVAVWLTGPVKLDAVVRGGYFRRHHANWRDMITNFATGFPPRAAALRPAARSPGCQRLASGRSSVAAGRPGPSRRRRQGRGRRGLMVTISGSAWLVCLAGFAPATRG
jgi:hypothetical protein